MKKIAIDDFGTEWYEISKKDMFHSQRFPCQVFSYIITDFGIITEYLSICVLETWVDWGLITEEELMEKGFKLRW